MNMSNIYQGMVDYDTELNRLGCCEARARPAITSAPQNYIIDWTSFINLCYAVSQEMTA